MILSTSHQRILSKIAAFAIIFATSNIFVSQAAHACKPAPGSKPASLENRVQTTSFVFVGKVTRVNQDKLTIRVDRTVKGKVPKTIILSGFNQTSCDNIIQETGGKYLFFAKSDVLDSQGRHKPRIDWSAVYDGAFGSVREWNKETETELKKLGFIKK
jgi:hypothetical protein